MFGVICGTLPPATPGVSKFMSSAVISNTLSLSVLSAVEGPFAKHTHGASNATTIATSSLFIRLVLRIVIGVALAHVERAVELLLQRGNHVGAGRIAGEIVELVRIVPQVIQLRTLR